MYAAYVIVVIAYFPSAVAGYAAFGNTVNPDVLLSVSNPVWLIKAANAMVVVHLTASYQVLCLGTNCLRNRCVCFVFGASKIMLCNHTTFFSFGTIMSNLVVKVCPIMYPVSTGCHKFP